MKGSEAAGLSELPLKTAWRRSATLVLSDVVTTLTSRKESCNDHYINQMG